LKCNGHHWWGKVGGKKERPKLLTDRNGPGQAVSKGGRGGGRREGGSKGGSSQFKRMAIGEKKGGGRAFGEVMLI